MNYLLILAILTLSGCGTQNLFFHPKYGTTYKVTSGFYEGCNGIAEEQSTFSGKVMLHLYCGEQRIGYKFFDSHEVKEVQ